VSLGAKRLLDSVASEALILSRILEAVGSLGRLVLPLEDLSALFNAQAALQALQTAVVTGAPSDITKLPQYQRFTSNVDTFLGGPASAVKQNGAIVPTPQEARASIPSLMGQLVEAHAGLVSSSELLAGSIDDFTKVNLASLVASAIISKAQATLGQHAADLSKLSADQRLETIRQPVLDLLAAKATIRTFGSSTGPTPFFSIRGSGNPFSDADHLATSAVLQGTKSPPYNVQVAVNDTLQFTVDGGVPFNVRLPQSFYASISGSIVEQAPAEGGPVDGYLIGNGTNPTGLPTGTTIPNNNQIHLKIRTNISSSDITIPLTLSVDAIPAFAPFIQGTVDITAVSIPSVEGTTITIQFDGGTVDSITFTGLVDYHDISTQINAVITGGISHSNPLTGSPAYLKISDTTVGGTITLGGSALGPLGFTAGTTSGAAIPVVRRTAQQICSDINTWLSGIGITQVIGEPYFFPTAHFEGKMDVTPGIGSSATFDVTVPAAGSVQPVLIGDILLITAGPNTDIWDVTAVNSSSEIVASARTVTPSSETARSVSVGPRDRGVRIRAIDPLTVDQEWNLTLLGDTTPALGADTTLGLPPGMSVQCQPLLPSDVTGAINQQTRKLVASTVLVNGIATQVVTDPTNPFHVTCERISGVGALAYTPSSPNRIVVTGTLGLLSAGVTVGDVVVLPGQGSSVWHVTVVTDTGFTATDVTSTATAGAQVAFLIGPVLAISEWKTLQITTGPNRGNYLVAAQGASPLDILLKSRTPIPHYADQLTLQGVPQLAGLGSEVVTFASLDRTTTSSIVLNGTGATLFVASAPASAAGTTPYFFIPKPTSGGTPTPGDLLEFFATTYAEATSIHVLETVDGVSLGLVLGVTPDVSVSPSSWAFDPQPPPYGALRHGHVADFDSFRAEISAWLSATVNQPLYFQALNRVINPLLANKNPTAAEIGDATSSLLALAQKLTISEAQALGMPTGLTLESILKSYSVDSVSAVDTLIKTYIQKGADRAIDTLLSGQFSSFFSLTADSSSYAGTMQAAMRAVAQNDLPVRRMNRVDAVQSRLVGAAESPDYEYDTSDTESGMKPDAPADFEKS
jgi:hypothetical protein